MSTPTHVRTVPGEWRGQPARFAAPVPREHPGSPLLPPIDAHDDRCEAEPPQEGDGTAAVLVRAFCLCAYRAGRA